MAIQAGIHLFPEPAVGVFQHLQVNPCYIPYPQGNVQQPGRLLGLGSGKKGGTESDPFNVYPLISQDQRCQPAVEAAGTKPQRPCFFL